MQICPPRRRNFSGEKLGQPRPRQIDLSLARYKERAQCAALLQQPGGLTTERHQRGGLSALVNWERRVLARHATGARFCGSSPIIHALKHAGTNSARRKA